jgi:hypothetical protein
MPLIPAMRPLNGISVGRGDADQEAAGERQPGRGVVQAMFMSNSG